MMEIARPRWRWNLRAGVLSLVAAGTVSGCTMVPRERIEESQRLTQTLRTENARLKDEVIGLRTQNRDYADRALDDLRRLTARGEAIERLEQSVQAYQDDRDRLAAAYRRLAVSLGRTSEDGAVEPTVDRRPAAPAGARSPRPEPDGASGAEDVTGEDDANSSPEPARPRAGGSGP